MSVRPASPALRKGATELSKRDLFRGVSLSIMLAFLVACAASTPTAPRVPAGHQPAEEAAVLETVDRFMAAISRNDLETMRAMHTPEGMTYQGRATGGAGMEITAKPIAYFTDPARRTARAPRERYWSPTVLIRGGIAVVWAPYEFWVDGKTSHCGVDVFDLVKIAGRWTLANAMWTTEPNACAELRPADARELRPAP